MVLNMTKQSLFCLLETVETKERCFYSFVYASNNGKEIRVLWEEINAVKIIVDENPWCLLGDFNVTIKAKEHSSEGSTINEDMQEFIDCLNEVEKLDRIIVNQSFITKFGNAIGHFRPFMTSDHCPAVLSIARCLRKKKKSFRFLNFIMEKGKFIPVVKEGWEKEIEGKVGLDSKRDRNTKFFHKIIKSRENLNKITSVCNKKGEKFEGNEVAEQFVNHVKKFLKVDKDCEDLDDLELFHHKISNDAKNMIKEVIEDEIKEAMFDIGENKALGPDGFHKRMVEWIMTCVSSASFTIGINGKRHGFFRSRRGLRQWDSISPYLFTLVMEENVRKDILQTLPFKVGKLPVRYLGISLLAKRINDNYALVDMIDNETWCWPEKWTQTILVLTRIPVPRLNENMKYEVKWKSTKGKLIDFNIKNAWLDLRDKMESVKWWKEILRNLESIMNMSNVPSEWKDIIEKVAEQPCNNTIRSVVRRIALATVVYYIWKERNSRIFNDTKVTCEIVLQMIMENIRLQIQRLQVKMSK
uniref:RNA-directed DNA polymerase, eukaryota, reverse transcriptase zinc-binding domain protein n=1 Tax=Tanacetum cinerariifolium TaxID=118510 RepID=A0A699HHH1_TANCI|nr:hypothetical protein [Tanacetum cinerariifolium]